VARLNARWYNFSKRGQTWDRFWQDTPTAGGGPTYFGILKRWNGSSWVKGKLVVYTGAWVAKPLTRWDGSDWKLVDTTGV